MLTKLGRKSLLKTFLTSIILVPRYPMDLGHCRVQISMFHEYQHLTNLAIFMQMPKKTKDDVTSVKQELIFTP